MLNANLYKKLLNRYKAVKVANEGLATSYQIVYDGEGRPRLVFTQVGEAYRICCPFCNDTRFRLYVNHLYGREDETGRKMDFLAMCWNENCLGDDRYRETFYEQVGGSCLATAPLKVGASVTQELRALTLPGPCTKLHKLPVHHEANVYVRSRDLDPMVLGKFYGVSYCHNSIYPLARGRLLVPIHKGRDMVGWQCRHVGELPWKDKEAKKRGELPPKYFTAPGYPKAQWLPNLDVARQYHTGVLVEGFFDVFRAGPMCMPLLGSSINPLQRKLLTQAFGKRSAVLLLDPDVKGDEKKWPKIHESILDIQRQMPLAVVWLPEGSDPGSLEREVTCEIIREQARDQHVKVSFAKVT